MQQQSEKLDNFDGDDRMSETVGRRIKQARKALGLSLEDLAAQVGISIGQLSKMENGKVTPSVPSLARLGLQMKRPIAYFLQTDADIPRSLATIVPAWDTEAQALRRFAELVNEQTAGALSISVFSESQIGPGTSQVDGLINGLIDIYAESLAFFGKHVDAIRPLSLPFFFDGEQHQQIFVSSKLFENEIRRPLLKLRVELLPVSWRRGPTIVMISKEPLWSPHDLRGRKIRCPNLEVWTRFFTLLGAQPVLVQWPDVEASFIRGDFDAMITNLSYVINMRLTRIARYVSLLNYRPTDLNFAMHLQRYRMLLPPLQQAVINAAEVAGQVCSQLLDATNDQIATVCEQDNAIFSTVPSGPWREQSRKAIIEIERRKFWRKGLYAEIQALAATNPQ